MARLTTGKHMIPHIIHRIWLGSDPMPEEFRRYGETWREHHPDWDMPLWTDENLPELSCAEAIARGRNWGERTDLLRYELLRQRGGVYVDTDCECLRSIEPLLEGVTLFAAEHYPGKLGTALIGATPGHPAMARAVSEGAAAVGTRDYPHTTGPPFLTRLLGEFPEATIFPRELFYPYKWNEEPRDSYPDAYAVHHWGMTWRTPEQRVKLKLRTRVRTLEQERDDLQSQVKELKQKLKRARAKRDAFRPSPLAAIFRRRG